MSSGIRWNSKLFASYYLDHEDFRDMRKNRKELLAGLIQNTFAANAEGHEDVITTFNHFRRQWTRFIELVEEGVRKKIKKLGIDWDMHTIRSYDSKDLVNFRKIHCDTDEKETLLYQIYTVRRSDYDNLVKKTDEFAYKYWKGDISAREFLTGQHQLKEAMEN